MALGSSLMKTNDNRVKLEEGENGNTLVILLADTKDAGEYSCQISISGGEPTEIRHSVRIRGKETKKRSQKICIPNLVSINHWKNHRHDRIAITQIHFAFVFSD